MSNWLNEQLNKNKQIFEKTYPLIMKLKRKYPDEKAFDMILSRLESGMFNEGFLLETREILRKIIINKEKDLFSIQNDINVVNAIIKEYEHREKYDKDECFPPFFDFKYGEGYYYLKFPKLNKKIDSNSKNDTMQDRYLQEFISASVRKYMLGREHNFRKFKEFSLIFIHYYDQRLKDYFDTDNIEIKRPIDAINSILIENDTVDRSHIYQITVPSKNEFTELFVLESHDLGNAILRNLSKIR